MSKKASRQEINNQNLKYAYEGNVDKYPNVATSLGKTEMLLLEVFIIIYNSPNHYLIVYGSLVRPPKKLIESYTKNIQALSTTS